MSTGVPVPDTESAVRGASIAPHLSTLELIFEDNYDRIYRFCFVRTRSQQAADDIAAETFADAARRAAGGRVDEVDTAWLFMVAKRRIVDHWRATERQRRKINRVVAQPRQLGDGDPAESTEVDAASYHVAMALDDLPDRQRAALLLRYVDEHSVGEVADALGLSYRAAESMLSRARRSFVRAWEGQR